MRSGPVLRRASVLLWLPAVLGAALAAGSAGASGASWAATPRVTDPWPGSPVLTRLFTLPSGREDRDRLIRALDLTVAQVRELQRLADSERGAARAVRTLGPVDARALNVKLAALTAEKDRKVRRLLGADYVVFRAWVRAWWQEQVRRARRS